MLHLDLLNISTQQLYNVSDAEIPRRLNIRFNLIKRDLNSLPAAFDTQDALCWKTRESIKDLLILLNKQPRLPVYFHMEVLHFFQESYPSYLDAEYVLLALHIYQKCIQHVSGNRVQNHKEVIQLSIAALIMIVFSLHLSRHSYCPIDQEKTRIVSEIMQHAFVFFPYIEINQPELLSLLGKKFAEYRILRRLDFFSKSIVDQEKILHLLDQHVASIDVSFYAQGEVLNLSQETVHTYLPVYPQFCNTTTKVITSFPSHVSQYDMILLDLSPFLRKVVPYSRQKNHISNNAAVFILDALLRYTRSAPRHLTLEGQEVYLDFDSATAFSNKRLYKKDCAHAQAKRERSSWFVRDYSKTGVKLQRQDTKKLIDFQPSTLIGVQWASQEGEHDVRYHLGFLRWYKTSAVNEELGIEFIKVAYVLRLAVLHTETFIVIMQERKNEHIVWIPNVHVKKHDSLYFRQYDIGFRISKVLKQGANYTRCEIEIS